MHSGEPPRTRRLLADLAVTLVAWGYFLLAFVLAFGPFYVLASLLPRRDRSIQGLNRLYMRGFFALLRAITPKQRWCIDAAITEIRGGVLLCNHLSYLDPLLLIAGLQRSSTVVRADFFRLPIFGWVLRSAGYLPSQSSGRFAALMLRQMDTIPALLAAGGTLFIFPEGTRSRDGRLQPLQPAALKLARRLRVPLHIWRIDNTQVLFAPGRFLFGAGCANTIRMQPVAVIRPGDALYQAPLPQLSAQLHALMDGRGAAAARGTAHNAEHSPAPRPSPLSETIEAQP